MKVKVIIKMLQGQVRSGSDTTVMFLIVHEIHIIYCDKLKVCTKTLKQTIK